MKKLLMPLVLAASLMSGSAFADSTKDAPDSSLKQNAEKGWFFYEKPPAKVEPKPQPVQIQSPAPDQPKPDKCKKVDTWSTDCGFVDPGRDFAFQEKQRDALMQNMVMSKNDPKAVEAFQYYMRWVMQRASEVANIWTYNMAQNPDLDPTVKAPVSTFGLRLMTEVEHGNQREIFKALQNEEAQLVYFTRTDCEYCHSMSRTVRDIATKAGIPVWDASLDTTCLPEFGTNCGVAPATLQPAQMLQVTTVPTLFLYIKPNTWIRLSTGVNDETSITSRLVSFFAAYRNALLKGVSNGHDGRASVDFSDTNPDGNAKGVAAGSPTAGKVPSEEIVSKMLGK